MEIDYEKKYNEALERAKGLSDSFYQTMNAKRVVEEIFPELAESEDERIINELIESFEAYAIESSRFDDCLAWLENQKESLHVSEIRKDNGDNFTDEDERTRKEIVKFILYKVGHLLDEETEHRFVVYLEKQKDSLHIEKTCKENADSFTDELEKEFEKYLSENIEFDRAGSALDKWNEGCYLNRNNLEDIARHFADWQKEQKEIPLMNGDADLYFDNWNQQKQNPTKRQCFEEGIRYAKRLQKEPENASASTMIPSCWKVEQKEQKPVEKQDYSGLTDLERAIHRGFLCAGVENVPVGIIQETAKDCLAHISPVEIHLDNPNIQKPDSNVVVDTRTDGTGELDGKALLYTADKSYKIGYRDGVASVKPAEWSEEDEGMLRTIISDGSRSVELDSKQIAWLKSLPLNLKKRNEDVAKLCSNEWSKEDEEIREEVTGDLCALKDYIVEYDDNWLTNPILKNIKKRISWLKSLPERFILQPKQEWREEDEKMLNELITIMDGGKVTSGTYLSEYVAWLKSLRPQIIDSAPLYTIEQVDEKVREAQEWNEKDEKMMSDIIDIIKSDSPWSLEEEAEHIDWLKSLRPPLKDKEMKLKILKYLSTRCSSLEFEEVENYLNNLRPSWKPTEEQMEALEDSIRFDKTVFRKKKLESLLEELKKLKDAHR